ncbi:MAG: hypothetical protein GF416_08820 [Candidatus Altiarchaeales archaeon]|nr:hypothetical protein [Candidatus Altiarchaeales archaeon]MBD3417219.1 hypothetical protein [Candidatus Altiarchaeales archaeon]
MCAICDDAGDCVFDDSQDNDCSGNDIVGVETCYNDPDDAKDFTWDYREEFISECSDVASDNGFSCTTGNETITHACDKDTNGCGAECEDDDDCYDMCAVGTPGLLMTGGTCNGLPGCDCTYSGSTDCNSLDCSEQLYIQVFEDEATCMGADFMCEVVVDGEDSCIVDDTTECSETITCDMDAECEELTCGTDASVCHVGDSGLEWYGGSLTDLQGEGEGICCDGVDNDCDGLIDCADDDCAGEPECEQPSCPSGMTRTVDPIETVAVDSSLAAGVDSTKTLISGMDYLLVASSTYKYSDGENDKQADAEYQTIDSWLNLRTDLDDSILDLLVNEVNYDFGCYRDSHEYKYLYSPSTTGTVNFLVSDWFGTGWPKCNDQSCIDDNSDSLTVDIYCCADEPGEEVSCDDGLDNDCDNLIDCEDPGCAGEMGPGDVQCCQDDNDNDCSGSLPAVFQCDYDPDDNDNTWDFHPMEPFVCEDNVCTDPGYNPNTWEHTCADDDDTDGIAMFGSETKKCGAECDQDSDCDDTICWDGCLDGKTLILCPDLTNDCDAGCECEDNQCPLPSTQACEPIGHNPDGDDIDTECGDNCPDMANNDQVDTDGDGLGDVCDLCDEHRDTLILLSGEGPDEVPLTFIHTAWTANIPGATWVWSEDPISDTTVEVEEEFTRTFYVMNDLDSAILDIAADNSYEVYVNGDLACDDQTEKNFNLAGQDQCDLTSYMDLDAENTVTFKVKNWAVPGSTYTSNPAGLLYKLVITYARIDTDGDGLGDACDPCPYDAGNDADNDGYCAASCDLYPEEEPQPPGVVLDQPVTFLDCGDCNDNNPDANPGMAEVCDDCFDNDCNGYADCDEPEACINAMDENDKLMCQMPSCPVVDTELVSLELISTVPVNVGPSYTDTYGPYTSPSMWYILKPMGTYDYGPKMADAECSDRPLSSYGPGWRKGEDVFPSVVGLDVQVNDNNINWGGFNSAHTYYDLQPGTDDNVKFSVYDNQYADNIGPLNVEVWACCYDHDMDEYYDQDQPGCCVNPEEYYDLDAAPPAEPEVVLCDNCMGLDNNQTDTDFDGIGDACDCGADELCTAEQYCIDMQTPDPDCDIDDDGVANPDDNCVNTPNGPDLGTCEGGEYDGELCNTNPTALPGTTVRSDCGSGTCSMNQEDSDQDGIGDVCDPDADGDGVTGCGKEQEPNAAPGFQASTTTTLAGPCDCDDVAIDDEGCPDSVEGCTEETAGCAICTHPGADDPLNDGIDSNCVNNPPVCAINDPTAGTTYVHMSAPVDVNFLGGIGDEEDCLDIVWDFGNGNTWEGNNCEPDIVPAGLPGMSGMPGDNETEEPSTYDGVGTFTITLTVTENNDTAVNPGASDSDTVDIFIMKERKRTTTTLAPPTTVPSPPTTQPPSPPTTVPSPPTTLPAPTTTLSRPAPPSTLATVTGSEVEGEEPGVIGYAAAPIDYNAVFKSSGFRNLMVLLILIAGYGTWARDTQLKNRAAAASQGKKKGK